MLAGRMKLKNFLLMMGSVAFVGAGATYYACDSGGEPPRDMQATSAEPSPAVHAGKPAAPEPSPTAMPAAAAAAPAAAGADMRPVDRALLSWQGKSLGKDKVKDATRGKPYKINLYQDSGNSLMNRAKVDLDRDDKWDEKWTFDGPVITRQVAPADDESYTETYTWDGTGWIRQ